MRRDAGSAVAQARDAGLREAGASECVWGGEARIGRFYQVGLAFVALPDAEAAYTEHVQPVIDTQYTIVDTLADGSQYSCAYGQCSFDVLVGEVWVGGTLTSAGVTDDEALELLLVPILTEIVASVETAAGDPGPAWTVPSGVVGSWGDCGDDAEIVVGLREVFGKPDLYPVGDGSTPIEAAVRDRVGSSPCTLWADDLTLVIDAELVPGGSWALDGMLADPPEDPYLGVYAPVKVAGAGDAVVACLDGSGCSAFLAIGGSLVQVRALPDEREAFLSELGALVELVASAA